MIGATAALMSVLPLLTVHANAQQNATDLQDGDALVRSATFEVASIRADKPSPDGHISGHVGYLPDGRFTASGMTLKKLVCLAYGLEDYQVIGGPDWFSSDRYTVEAKAESAVEEQLPKLSEEQRKRVGQHMAQVLLADRLKLVMHQESRDISILALVAAKNGPKLHEATPGDTYANGLKDRNGQGRAGMMRFMNGKVTAQGVTLDALATQLTEQLHQIVQNKTGLNGNYDFTLEWTPESDHDGRPPMTSGEAGGAVVADSSGLSIITALQEQLGLKLESKKSAMPVFVVDHLERPSEN
jgi:uncharacterized protein (TIGR03435 family)